MCNKMKRPNSFNSDGGSETKRPRLLLQSDDGNGDGDRNSKWPSTNYYSLSGTGTATSARTASKRDSPVSLTSSCDRPPKKISVPSKEDQTAANLLSLSRAQYPKLPTQSRRSSWSSSSSSLPVSPRGASAASPRNEECDSTTKRAEKVGSSPPSSPPTENRSSPPSARHLKDSSGLIEAPHSNDVLCGRGPGFYSHEGNVAFRKLANDRKAEYVLASSHDDKTKITREVMAQVRNLDPPGRFLERRNKIDGEAGWVEADPEKQFAKTSQALREGAPTIRNQARTAILGGDTASGSEAAAANAAVGLFGKGNSATPVEALTAAQLKMQAQLIMKGHTIEFETSGTPAVSNKLPPVLNKATVPASTDHHATQAGPTVHVQIHGGAAQQAQSQNQWTAAAAAAAANNSGYESLLAASLAGRRSNSGHHESLLAQVASLNASLFAHAANANARRPPAPTPISNGHESLLATVANLNAALTFANAAAAAPAPAPRNDGGASSLLACLNATLLANSNQDAMRALRESVLKSQILNLLRTQQRE